MSPVRVIPNALPALDVKVAHRIAGPDKVQDKAGPAPTKAVQAGPTVGQRDARIESSAAGQIRAARADPRAAATGLARGARRATGTHQARAGHHADSPALAARRDTEQPTARVVRRAGLLAAAVRLDLEMPRVVRLVDPGVLPAGGHPAFGSQTGMPGLPAHRARLAVAAPIAARKRQAAPSALVARAPGSIEVANRVRRSAESVGPVGKDRGHVARAARVSAREQAATSPVAGVPGARDSVAAVRAPREADRNAAVPTRGSEPSAARACLRGK